jgi:hypothetical protein
MTAIELCQSDSERPPEPGFARWEANCGEEDDRTSLC